MDKFVKELLTEDVLVETAKRYGIGKEKVYFVGGFENFIFGFEANDKSFIVRISHSSHRGLD
ncbi:MAG TPA: aminoglycoside phosphotransferase, partial [Acholeplasmataceae bacterium]|nr:aminoglycoside phosphotransferase [Acholeplasmataceae bacterium]